MADEPFEHLVEVAGGDARQALNILEGAVALAEDDDARDAEGRVSPALPHVEAAAQQRVLAYDRAGDGHYDTVSAFIKSLRGNDPDAALYWLAAMVAAGEDPRFIARGLIISASEDVVAVVMVLQRLEGLSDREAVERYTFDARWKYAAGGQPFDAPGFAHTVLVDMRARLARSGRPERIFERTLEIAKGAGLLGVRRVLDSTPLYDAVATMDTVTLVRSAIRGVLGASGEREPDLRAVLRRDDEYRTGGKPTADWDDADARAALVDALARDGEAVLLALEGQTLPGPLAEAATLLATVLGQDLEDGGDGRIRIARRVAPDRVISTVDPETRHGHKTSHHAFDGYKGHVAIDPDAELVTATAVTPGNAGDASVAIALLGTDLAQAAPAAPPVVYGDAAYGTGPLLEALGQHGAVSRLKVQGANGVPGHFTKDDFAVDLDARTVTCPAGQVARLTRHQRGELRARFRGACAACPLASRCTTSVRGRSIDVGPHEAFLTAGRAASRDPAWLADYRATRPKVERARPPGATTARGRRARVRGRQKVGADFSLLGDAVNLARLARLGITGSGGTWAVRPA